MKKYILLLIVIIYPHLLLSQWLDPQSVQSTVLIEKIQNNIFIPHGTGFLLYNYKSPDKPIVVTCSHLIKDKSKICVRVNADSSLLAYLKKIKASSIIVPERKCIVENNSVRVIVELKKEPKTNYYVHPELDIAAFYISIPLFNILSDSGKVEIKFANKLSIPKSMLKMRKQLSLGDEVYFIGFPFGFGTEEIIDPIIRSGSIAWKSNKSKEFLLDAFSYGGNSGSPIFQKRLLGTKPGYIEWDKMRLVGMVVGHRSLILKNVLTQPNPDELKFGKGDIDMNLGLASCVYVDDILEVAKKVENLTKSN